MTITCWQTVKARTPHQITASGESESMWIEFSSRLVNANLILYIDKLTMMGKYQLVAHMADEKDIAEYYPSEKLADHRLQQLKKLLCK